MIGSINLTEALSDELDDIMRNLLHKAKAECVLLADISGQLISSQGQMGVGDPATVAALAAGDLAAMGELSRQIGEESSEGAFLHEGDEKNIYLFDVVGSFILIVIFRNETPVGLVRLFATRATQKLEALADEFEETLSLPAEQMTDQQDTEGVSDDFGASLASELERAFQGL